LRPDESETLSPNENPDVLATAIPLPFELGNEDMLSSVVPNENIVFLLDGSEISCAAVPITAGGGTLNENPGADASLTFFPSTSLAPKENPLPLLDVLAAGAGADADSPKQKPANDDASGLDSETATAAAPNPSKDTDGLLKVSCVTLALAGVMAGVAVGPLNENPFPRKAVPLLIDEAAGDDDAAAPNENPLVPMPALRSLPSSLPRFILAGVAPSPVATNGLGLVLVIPVPNEKPPAPMTPTLAFTIGLLSTSVTLAPSTTASPAFGVSHEMHAVASLGFLTEQASHFHSPGLGLNKSPHPDIAAG
jgi:hypothetical protein